MADKLSHVHDDVLGYVPSCHFCSASVRIDADGLRYAGEFTGSDGPSILAVGDSFVFGDEVGDLEAWPAQLQRLIGCRVLNGGVTGYGFDQIVLRTELLSARFKPSAIIVGFISDDLRRTEMRRLWAHDKPWFDVEDGRLVLRGVPVVPRRHLLPRQHRARIESAMIGVPSPIMSLLGYHARAHPAGKGAAIGKLLVDRLAALQEELRTPIFLLAQYERAIWAWPRLARGWRAEVSALLEHAAKAGLGVIDSFARIAAEPHPDALYGSQHMNALGNRVVAGLLAAILRKRALDPSR